jgi:hypothetical protein
LNVVGDEQVQLCRRDRNRATPRWCRSWHSDARCRGHVFELAVAFVVKEAVAFERGDVDVVAPVVVEIGHGHADAVDFDVEAAAARDVGERAVMIVAVERCGCVRPRAASSLCR